MTLASVENLKNMGKLTGSAVLFVVTFVLTGQLDVGLFADATLTVGDPESSKGNESVVIVYVPKEVEAEPSLGFVIFFGIGVACFVVLCMIVSLNIILHILMFFLKSADDKVKGKKFCPRKLSHSDRKTNKFWGDPQNHSRKEEHTFEKDSMTCPPTCVANPTSNPRVLKLALIGVVLLAVRGRTQTTIDTKVLVDGNPSDYKLLAGYYRISDPNEFQMTYQVRNIDPNTMTWGLSKCDSNFTERTLYLDVSGTTLSADINSTQLEYGLLTCRNGLVTFLYSPLFTPTVVANITDPLKNYTTPGRVRRADASTVNSACSYSAPFWNSGTSVRVSLSSSRYCPSGTEIVLDCSGSVSFCVADLTTVQKLSTAISQTAGVVSVVSSDLTSLASSTTAAFSKVSDVLSGNIIADIRRSKQILINQMNISRINWELQHEKMDRFKTEVRIEKALVFDQCKNTESPITTGFLERINPDPGVVSMMRKTGEVSCHDWVDGPGILLTYSGYTKFRFETFKVHRQPEYVVRFTNETCAIVHEESVAVNLRLLKVKVWSTEEIRQRNPSEPDKADYFRTTEEKQAKAEWLSFYGLANGFLPTYNAEIVNSTDCPDYILMTGKVFTIVVSHLWPVKVDNSDRGTGVILVSHSKTEHLIEVNGRQYMTPLMWSEDGFTTIVKDSSDWKMIVVSSGIKASETPLTFDAEDLEKLQADVRSSIVSGLQDTYMTIQSNNEKNQIVLDDVQTDMKELNDKQRVEYETAVAVGASGTGAGFGALFCICCLCVCMCIVLKQLMPGKFPPQFGSNEYEYGLLDPDLPYLRESNVALIGEKFYKMPNLAVSMLFWILSLTGLDKLPFNKRVRMNGIVVDYARFASLERGVPSAGPRPRTVNADEYQSNVCCLKRTHIRDSKVSPVMFGTMGEELVDISTERVEGKYTVKMKDGMVLGVSSSLGNLSYNIGSEVWMITPKGRDVLVGTRLGEVIFTDEYGNIRPLKELA